MHLHTALLTPSGIKLLSDKKICVGQDESPLIPSPWSVWNKRHSEVLSRIRPKCVHQLSIYVRYNFLSHYTTSVCGKLWYITGPLQKISSGSQHVIITTNWYSKLNHINLTPKITAAHLDCIFLKYLVVHYYIQKRVSPENSSPLVCKFSKT